MCWKVHRLQLCGIQIGEILTNFVRELPKNCKHELVKFFVLYIRVDCEWIMIYIYGAKNLWDSIHERSRRERQKNFVQILGTDERIGFLWDHFFKISMVCFYNTYILYMFVNEWFLFNVVFKGGHLRATQWQVFDFNRTILFV